MMLLGFVAAHCGRQESPTQPRMTMCANPATLKVSVTPLRDPEAFAIFVQDQYDLSSVAASLRQIPGVSNVQQYERTHFLGADLRPPAVENVRCVAGITQVAQARTNIPPP
jgi:hypothetical protein